MRKYFDIVKDVRLFNQINENQLDSLLRCLQAKVKTYSKGEYILTEDDKVKSVGIILKGSAEIIKDDVFGRRSIISVLRPKDLFGEALACLSKPQGLTGNMINVYCSMDAEVMFIDYEKIVHTCSSSCSFHSKLIQNMLGILAQKNVLLNKKLEYLMIKGLRDRISAYLIDMCAVSGKKEFDITINRQQLADYLSVDRSALSRELGRMKNEGLIDYKGSYFKVIHEI